MGCCVSAEDVSIPPNIKAHIVAKIKDEVKDAEDAKVRLKHHINKLHKDKVFKSAMRDKYL